MVGVIEQLNEAIEAVAALDPNALDHNELNRLVAEVQRSTARLDSARAQLVGGWDARQAWAPEGAETGAAWLRHRCRLSGPRASSEVRLARQLRTMPLTAAALADGQITSDHMRRLVASRNERTAAMFERDEALLVEFASSMTFANFDKAMRRWDQLADTDGAEGRAAARHGARRWHMSQLLDGSWTVDAHIDELAGEQLHNAMEHETDRMFQQDWQAAKAEHGDALTHHDLARTPAQRRADALVELVARGHGAGPRSDRPLLNAVVDHPHLALACELASGTPITPAQLAALLREADVRTITFDRAGQPTTASRKRRFFTGVLREMIELRDRECQHPLCDEPASRCEVDHVVPWPAGPTTVDNGQLLCRFHHRLKTRGDPPPV